MSGSGIRDPRPEIVMHPVSTELFRLTRGTLATTLVLVTAAACAKSDKAADSLTAGANAPISASAMPADSMAGHDMSGMAGMTGDADHDFLRTMSDHHKGLVQLAHMTKDRKGGGTAVADAKKLDAAQDKELDQMVTMLEKVFKDPYTPKVMPEHQAMADALKGKSGKAYDRTFYENIIKHHQEAIAMIDGYLPKAKSAMLKQMAEKMKSDQTREIADFQQKVARLGA